MAKTLQPESAKPTTLKAVVLYGEFESAVKARALLERAAHQAGWEDLMEPVFWRFDVMSQPLVAREALYRAADADMILLVAQEATYPPDWLLEWLEMWAIKRRTPDAILAAWCHGHDTAALSEGVARLSTLARRYGLDWLCAEEEAHKAA